MPEPYCEWTVASSAAVAEKCEPCWQQQSLHNMTDVYQEVDAEFVTVEPLPAWPPDFNHSKHLRPNTCTFLSVEMSVFINAG